MARSPAPQCIWPVQESTASVSLLDGPSVDVPLLHPGPLVTRADLQNIDLVLSTTQSVLKPDWWRNSTWRKTSDRWHSLGLPSVLRQELSNACHFPISTCRDKKMIFFIMFTIICLFLFTYYYINVSYMFIVFPVFGFFRLTKFVECLANSRSV